MIQADISLSVTMLLMETLSLCNKDWEHIECLCWLIIKLTQLNLYSGDTSIQETFVSDPGCPLNRGPTVPKALNVCLHLYFENVM